MPPTGPRTTMNQHVDAYLSRIRGQVAPSTLFAHRVTLRRFASWWDSTRRVPKTLREADVEGYIWGPHECVASCVAQMHQGPGLRDTLGDGSLNNSLGRLGRFLSWAFRAGYVRGEVVQPTTSRVRSSSRRRLQLTVDQLVDLYEGAESPYERIICALAAYTGGRSGELNTIRIGDVDLDAGEIAWVRHKTRGDDALPVMAELDKEIRRWLRIYEEACGTPQPDWFLIPARRMVGRGVVRYLPRVQRVRGCHLVVKIHLARVLEVDESELRGEGVHTVRRSVARTLYERLREDHHSDPIAVVQALLGHASRMMTERYIGVESGRRERDKALRGRSVLRRGR